MTDKLVTVASYGQMFEATLAQNLLVREGIDAVLNGDAALCTILGPTRNAIRLQVPEEAAEQAATILAAYAADAALDRDWEEKAEHGQDVWVCSLCGEAISNRLSVCYSCTTPREGIRTSRPSVSTDVQTPPSVQTQPSTPRQADVPEPSAEPSPVPPSYFWTRLLAVLGGLIIWRIFLSLLFR
jgi:hypothetical protein